MDRDISRNFTDYVSDVENHSDKALYPYLDIHIFGPYEGDCYAYLTELKYRLQEHGFENAKVCVDRGNEPPDDATDTQEKVFARNESEEFLEDADVAIFLFLDYIVDRPTLPERSLKESMDGDDEPKEMNSSVVRELEYWLEQVDADRELTLILFEGEMFAKMGSVVTGKVEAEGIDYEEVDQEDIDSAAKEARQRSMNWAMGPIRDTLKDRYTEDQLGS